MGWAWCGVVRLCRNGVLSVYNAEDLSHQLQDAFEECGQSSLATKLEHCVIATIDDENS